MNINIHLLNASGRFSPETNKIRYRLDKAISKTKQLIPLSDIDIVVQNSKQVIPGFGIGGFSPNAHTVIINLDPDNEKYNKAIQEELERVLPHEAHHCMRWRGPGYGKTLAETLVSEGLADHFEIEISGKSPQPWSKALNQEEINTILPRAKEYFKKSYDHRAWFYGSKEQGIPIWTGYAIGFWLVGDYLDKTNEKASQLVNKPAEDIIKLLKV